MMDLQQGDMVRLSSMKAKYFEKGAKTPNLTLDFSAGRGKTFLMLLLGAGDNDREMPSADALLNKIGWVYDPEKAGEELNKYLDENPQFKK